MPVEAATSRFSIRTRLALLYTLVAITAMALFAVAVDWQLAANFKSEHKRFLQAKAAELQVDLTDNGGDPQALLTEIAKETAGTALRQYEARVRDADGKTLGETPGMARELPPSAFPPSTSGGQVGSRDFRAGNHLYTLDSVTLVRGAKGLSVQIALDVTRDTALLKDFQRAMILALLFFTPLLAFSGRWVSGRGLAPLIRIANTTREITPARLSTRIPLAPPWPNELVDLVMVFNDMLDRIDAAFVRLSRFSADLAHELRTPLSNLSGEIEVCLMRPRSIVDYRTVIESGLEECRRLNTLIENLLFIARAEHADPVLHREQFDAAQACNWVVAQQAPGAMTHGVRVRISGDAGIDADPLLFRQAVTNLLSNAIRHSPAREAVMIAIAADAEGGVSLSVHNSGEAIPAKHLPHLFDRFYQVDAARTRNTGRGTGLGLSIVKTIVDLHHGTVRLESSPGAGTTATMWFPSAKIESSK